MSRARLVSWSLRRRVAVLFTVAGILLSGVGLLAVVTAVDSNDNLDVILNKTGPMRLAGQDLSAAYLDQETGIRGYALSRKAENLQPYQAGLQTEQDLLIQLETLNDANGNARIRTDLRVVRERADAWRRTVAEPIIVSVERGEPAAAGIGTREFDALRESVNLLQADILTLRNAAVDAARHTSTLLIALQVATAVIVVVAGVVLMLLLDRLINRPVTDLAEQVRKVAGGDYERAITSSGSPELRGLAADVDGMRRQIAAELTVVREARAQVEAINLELQAKAEELTRSNRDLEQFAYVASHDLQEPLRKVASFCQLLQRRYAGQMDERADQYISFAVDGAQRMQRLINDLLAFSRIGRITAGFKDVDLDRVLPEVASQLEARAGDDADISWAGMPVVEGEEPLLTTLFVNLIGNSLKFRRPDVPPVIRTTAERDGDHWRINVRDNGIGIEREFADKVFVIFQRLHPRDAYEGTGIGLAIVKKIVEYHGGRIWLDLDVEEGTSIWLTLPAGVEPRADEEPPTAGASGATGKSAAAGASEAGENPETKAGTEVATASES
ncbi:sensor histidine kinase [Actinoplanes derwentensis]|uniref:histidine kinase n=1 Tax=Actinoplanes derwentensis TaxID=113562 RepID=A0A1H1W170_9ACTN|nr:sensor histidine kinase [Actinoplanes derwentensis]GID84014.1 histidine kinase [Actinoplanes derwentensis]SDS90755.1 HAMP domain-containing protein [Actinoplanes derwentensis]